MNNNIIFNKNNIKNFYNYLNNNIKTINFNKSYLKHKNTNEIFYINDINNNELYNYLEETLIKDIFKNYTNKNLNEKKYYEYNFDKINFIKIFFDYIYNYVKLYEQNKFNDLIKIFLYYFGYLNYNNKIIFLYQDNILSELFNLNLNLEFYFNVELLNNNIKFICFNLNNINDINDININSNFDDKILQDIILLIKQKQNLEYQLKNIDDKYNEKIKSLKKQNEKLQNDINKYKSIIKNLQSTINDANNI